MSRVFLSHSSDDKEYVEEVATQLTRVNARIDSRSFRPGEDFRDEIRRVMDETETFVLFVSPKSLASSWVQFEVDEAETRRLRGKLRRTLAIFIDGFVDPGLLPEWLARVRAVRHTSPDQSARTISNLLLEASPELKRPFIGRNEDLQRGVRKLSTDDPPPRILVVSGLEGVGRRSFVRRLVSDALSLDLGPVFTVERAGTLEDLFLDSHLSSTLLGREEAEREITAFRKLASRHQTREVADQLLFLAQEGTVPCLIDRGGMLDSSGRYLEVYAELIGDYLRERDSYLCLIHSRVPDFHGLPSRHFLFERRLRPLTPPDSQALISRLLRESGVVPEPAQAARLGDATHGYPPAAYYLGAIPVGLRRVRRGELS